MNGISEDAVERAMLEWLASLGWSTAHGLDISPPDAKTPGTQRASYREVALASRLREAIARLNPLIPPAARDDALRRMQVRIGHIEHPHHAGHELPIKEAIQRPPLMDGLRRKQIARPSSHPQVQVARHRQPVIAHLFKRQPVRIHEAEPRPQQNADVRPHECDGKQREGESGEREISHGRGPEAVQARRPR